MSTETVRSGFDSWAGADKPSLEHPREKTLRLDSGEALAYLWLKNPAPAGATVTRATLTLRAKGASSGSRTLSVHRVSEKWTESRLNWNNKPAVIGTAATASVGALSDGDAISFDVTSIVQAWASGASNFGFRVSTSATTRHFVYALNSSRKPVLTVEWSDAPSQPTNLRPSEAATSLAKPHLTFDYRDVSGNTALAAVRVEISTTATFDAGTVWDSGEVLTTEAGLDLSTTSYPGITAGQTVYWRAYARDGAGLWSAVSEAVSMTRTAKPTVSITNLPALPAVGQAFEPTPPILWSVTGGTQTRWEVLVYEASDLTRAVHSSRERTGTATSYTIPDGVLDDDTTYRVEVRVWDGVAREATPGDDTYAAAVAHFNLATSSTVAPVATLTAVPEDVSPWVILTWTRSTTPDAFSLVRDGKTIRTFLPEDVFVSGTTYSYRYFGARPNREHVYEVRAIVNGTQSAGNATASLTTSPSGLWLVDADRAIDVTLWGNDEGSWSAEDDASVYTPVGSTQVVRIVNGMRGLEGSLSGLLMEGFGKTFEQMEADVYAIKSNPTSTVRIVAGDENFEALIGNVRVSPKPETRQGRIVKSVSFDFWQVGALPFKALT